MKVGDVAGSTSLIVVELIAVKTGKAVPSAYPNIPIIILNNLSDSVTRHAVVCRVMMAGGLKLLCLKTNGCHHV